MKLKSLISQSSSDINYMFKKIQSTRKKLADIYNEKQMNNINQILDKYKKRLIDTVNQLQRLSQLKVPLTFMLDIYGRDKKHPQFSLWVGAKTSDVVKHYKSQFENYKKEYGHYPTYNQFTVDKLLETFKNVSSKFQLHNMSTSALGYSYIYVGAGSLHL